MNFATTATAAAKKIVLALIKLDAYNPETDNDMAMAISTNIPDDCNVFICRIGDEIHITFFVENECVYGNMKAYFSSPSRGYTVSPIADETFPTNVTLSKKSTMTNYVAPPAFSEEAAAKPNDFTKDVNEATQRMIDAAHSLNDSIRMANAAEERIHVATKHAAETSVPAQEAAAAFSATATQAKEAQAPKAWYTSKSAKITGGVALTAVVATATYYGLKHFGISIPFMKNDSAE